MNNNIWIEVNLRNLVYNLKTIRKKLSLDTKIMGVIKQNAYGHGLINIAKRLEKEKIDFLGINSIDEAAELLDSKIKTPLLVLSNTVSFRKLDYCLKAKVRFTVMEKRLLKALDKAAKKSKRKALVHIKVDTGMGRLGVRHNKAEFFIEKVLSYKNIKIEGLYSHFSSAEEDSSYTNYQIKNFKELVNNLKKKNISIKLLHLCNSAGLVNFKNAHLDMVRTGLLLYGIKPHPSLKIKVKPVLKLKTKIIYIKKLPKNSFVSYGNTFKTRKDTLIGVVSSGYAYGFPWGLSGKAEVLIKGHLCKVLGRICMDHIIVDLSPLTSLPNIGDGVILIGKDRKKEITVEELSKKAGTIPYEVVSCLPSTIRRIYKE